MKNAEGLKEFAIGAQNAGANMLCVHSRTYAEPIMPAQHEHLYALKEHIDIPLIINGGIESYQDGIEKTKNCDGFYIGQASFGNPWIFSDQPAPKRIEEKYPIILKHAQYLIEDKGECVGTREIRKHLLQYIKGFQGAKQFRSQLVHVKCYQDIVNALDIIVGRTISFNSYSIGKWSGRRGSNSRHSAWKADALPTELLPQKGFYFITYYTL